MKLLYLGIPAAVFGGELLIKNHVEKKVQTGETRKAFGGLLLIRKYHNEGACLDLGNRHKRTVAACSLLLTTALSGLFAVTLSGKGNRWSRAGLALLLGGAWSNTYDRLKRKYVVDYFSFPVKWEPLRRIVFNLSDFCILIGALILALKGEA